MNRWRWTSAVLIVAVLAGATGCETVRRKFTRKRKKIEKVEPIFALEQVYRPEHPPEVRYQAHFAYWKAAHDDLLDNLDQATQSRRMRAARQAVKELRAMQALLEGPPAEGLRYFVREMETIEHQVANPALGPPRLAVMRSTIESLRRRIDKGYDYHKVKAHLKSDLPTAHAEQPATSN